MKLAISRTIAELFDDCLWFRDTLLHTSLPRSCRFARTYRATLHARVDGDVLRFYDTRSSSGGPTAIIDFTEPGSMDVDVIDVLKYDRRKAGRNDVILILPDTLVLRTFVLLPMARASKLRRMAEYQVPIVSPFRLGEVHHEIRPTRTSSPEGMVRVELVIIPRRITDRYSMVLGRLGLTIERYAIAPRADDADLLLLPRTEASRQNVARQFIYDVAIAALTAILIISIALSPLQNNAQSADTLRKEIAEMRHAASAALKVRNDISSKRATRAHVMGEMSARTRPRNVLSRLASILPDDVVLTDVQIKGQRVSITGFANNASRILATVENVDEFEDAKFNGVTSRDEVLKRERFSVTFSAAGAPK